MLKRASVVAFSLAAASCATTTGTEPQTASAEKQVCTDVPVESTGSRVGTEKVCRPAQ
jgi:hypothetical protein